MPNSVTIHPSDERNLKHNGTNDDDRIACHFCDSSVDNVEEAIDRDWCPAYFDAEDEIAEPVCPECQGRFLTLTDDGFELLPFANR